MNDISFSDFTCHDFGALSGLPCPPCLKENVIAGNTCLYGATGGEAISKPE